MKHIKFKHCVQFLIALIALTALYTSDFLTLFLAAGSLAALRAPGLGNVLNACVIDCELTDMSTSSDCKIRGGIKVAYWAQYDEIDWVAMAASALHFNTTTQVILDYIMVGAAVFKKLEFERKQGKYSFIFTEDDDAYIQTITMIFEGKSATLRNAFASSISCCKIILHVFDNNCLERVIGVEWDGDAFNVQLKTLRFGRHADESGESGDSKARDEMDLVGESTVPPLFATVGEANIPV